MLRRLLIIGAGGHGRSTAEAALLSGRWSEIAFVDDNYPSIRSVAEWPVIGSSGELEGVLAGFDGVVVALGDNKARAKKIEQIELFACSLVSIVHPRAFVSATAALGPGSTVMANATVGANAKLGKGCILNANSCADHDCELGDFAHLGVGVAIAGGVKVGEGAFMQAGTYATYRTEIEPWVTCG